MHNLLSGRSQVRFVEGHDERINETTVVRREYSLVAECDRSDPSSASAHGRHSSRITRPSSVVEGSSDVAIQATATHFHVTIELELEVNGKLHHTRRWVESVPRVLL